MLGQSAAALAQAEPAGQTAAYQPPRSFIVDGILLAVLLGAALFAICRSSRRS